MRGVINIIPSSSITVTSVPCFPLPYCGVQRLLFWPLALQGLGKAWQGLCNCCKFSVKDRYHGGCSRRGPQNMMMSLSFSVLVLLVSLHHSSPFLAAATFLNLSAPFSHLNLLFFFSHFLQSLSLPFSFYLSCNLGLFELFAATSPFLGGGYLCWFQLG